MTDVSGALNAQMMSELPQVQDHSQTTKDYTGTTHTTVNRLNSLSGISVSGDAAIILDEFLGGTGRFGQTVLKVKFVSTGDYVEIDLGAQDWSAGNADDDNLTLFMRALATFDNTQFDIELRNNAGALITDADYAIPAYTTARKPQFVNIDTASETLSDVRYIRIVYDGSGEIFLWLWDIVRTIAVALTKAMIVDVEAAHGAVAGSLKLRTANNTGTPGHIHRNSLANDSETITDGVDELMTGERIGWFIFHGIGTDTEIDVEAVSYSR